MFSLCLPSNAYYPRTPDYTLYSRVHACWHSSFGLRIYEIDIWFGNHDQNYLSPHTTPVIYSTDCSKAVVQVLVLLFVALFSTTQFVLCLTLCYSVLVFFSSFTIAITSPGEERPELTAFLYVCSICACLVVSVFSSFWCLERPAVCD